MAPPIIRDFTHELGRGGVDPGGAVLNEAWISFYTGRFADPCNVVIDFGPTTAYGSTAPVSTTPAGVSSFRLPIAPLTPGTQYHYRVTATSVPGAEVTVGPDQALTATPGNLPPLIPLTGVVPTGVVATGAVINWNTAAAQPKGSVVYGTNPAQLRSTAAENAGANATAHTLPLSGLTTATRYYYRIIQPVTDGTVTTSQVYSFITA